MKIYEITDKNIVWKNLMGVDLNFKPEFDRVVLFANVVINARHHNKFNNALLYIQFFKTRADRFLKSIPFEPADPDIIKLKQEVSNMITTLEKLENSLK